MTGSPLETAPTLAVLSPHYDDAVLSCGALLARRASAGLRTVVLTAMSTGGQRVWFKQRREEDARALARFAHCEGRALGMTDAPMRGHAYYEGLIFGGEPAHSTLVQDLATALTRALARPKADALLAPLGSGNHVDHRACFDAARASSAARAVPLYGYEDRPYALAEGATEARLYALGCEARAPWPRGRVHALLTSLEASPYFARYVPAGPLRTRARTRWAELLALAPPAPTATLTELAALRATRDEAQHAADASQEYRSQFDELYGDRAAHDALTEAHAARFAKGAPRVERYWGLA